MPSIKRNWIIVGVLCAVVSLCTQSRAETAQAKFHKAYYLERESKDLAGAATLYAEVAGDSSADAPLKAQAAERQALCREELVAGDFLSLMPPDTLVYAEIRRPGDQAMKLLGQLGLLAGDAKPKSPSGPKVAISPALIRGLLGAGGAAVAVTGFNPLQMKPTGVLVFHPGDLDVVRGLLETALPAAALPTDPIGGFATYKIEDKAFVTLTARLAVASTERGPIEVVIRRLTGAEKNSLAGNPRLSDAVKHRGDSLFFLAADAKMLMPYVQGIAAATGGAGKEMAMAQAVLDLNSLQSVVARAGVGDDGLSMALEIRLEKGHRNLLYNFARTAAINRDTLKCVPERAAGFLVLALNEAGSRFSATPTTKPDVPPIVTFLDVGREFFANVTSVAVFALTEDSPQSEGRSTLPNAAAVITVNDPSKSEALWRQLLGLAGLAAGAPSMEGETTTIEGVTVRSYALPNKIKIQFAAVEQDMIIALTPSVLARSIQSKRSGTSVLKDPIFAPSLSLLGPDSTRAFFVHLGRCAEIARSFMDADERKEIEEFLPLLSNTVVSAIVEHSGEILRVSGRVTGIPNIGELVSEKLEQEMGGGSKGKRPRVAQQAAKENEHRGQPTPSPEPKVALEAELRALVFNPGDAASKSALSEAFLKRLPDDAKLLNNVAWTLLTDHSYQGKFNELALRISQRSNELTEYGTWQYLDTLALAQYKSDRVEDAVKSQRKAIAHSKGQAAEELKARLAEFETAQQQNKEMKARND